MARTITASELAARLGASGELALIDPRREGDFAADHLFWATNLPGSVMELGIAERVPRRHTPIVLCDASDGSAEEAARLLAELGYGDVAILRGGCQGWVEAGFQLFSGVNVLSKAFGEFIEHAAGTPHLAPEELAALRQAGRDLVIFDARPLQEYGVMNIPGAVNCPGGDLVYRLFDGLPSTETLVVVNCAGRTRSIMGAQSLRDAGLRNPVVALRDGTMGWHLAGLALEHKAARRAGPPAPAALAAAKSAAAGVAGRAGVRPLDWDSYRAMAAEGAATTYLLDVRDPEEFALAHADGARSAPGGQLVQTFDAFVAVRGARLVLCDEDEVRAPMTAAWLRQMGWDQVYAIQGGLRGARLAAPDESPVQGSAHGMAVTEAAALWRDGRLRLLDLSTSKEYRQAHLPGALFCERRDLAAAIDRLAPDEIVLLISGDGKLAEIAAARSGQKPGRVRALAGGLEAWRAAGLPVESGAGNLPARPTDVFYRPYDLAENVEQAMRDYLAWEVGLLDRIAGEPGVRFRRAGAGKER